MFNKTVTRRLVKHKVDSVRLLVARRYKGGTEKHRIIHSCLEIRMTIISRGEGLSFKQ